MIKLDPAWDNGNYLTSGELAGFKSARKLGLLTYRNWSELNERFVNKTGKETIEHYLDYNSEKFIKRFDCNSYLALLEAMNSFNVGALNATDEIVLTTQYGLLGAFRHRWTDRLHSSIGASLSRADNDTLISGFAVPRRYESAHADIIWSPLNSMSIGAEYIWGRREDESGDNGTLNRLQFSAKYLY